MRLGVNPSALLECLHLEALGGCRHQDGLEQRGSSSRGWWLSSAPIVVIVRGSWPFLRWRAKRYSSGLLIVYVILILRWSCGTLLRVWRMMPISTWTSKWVNRSMRSSLSASKWTSVKIIVFIIWFRGDWSSLIFILVIDWFIPRLDGITILLSLFTLPQTSCQVL